MIYTANNFYEKIYIVLITAALTCITAIIIRYLLPWINGYLARRRSRERPEPFELVIQDHIKRDTYGKNRKHLDSGRITYEDILTGRIITPKEYWHLSREVRELPPGCTFSIKGPAASGRSTLLRWLALNLRGIRTIPFTGRAKWLWWLEYLLYCLPNCIRLRLPFYRVYVLYDSKRELLMEWINQIRIRDCRKRVFFMIDEANRQHDLKTLISAVKSGYPNSVIILAQPLEALSGLDDDQVSEEDSWTVPLTTPEDFTLLKKLLLRENREVANVIYEPGFVGSALTRLIGSEFWNVKPVIDSFSRNGDSKLLFQLVCLSDFIAQGLPESIAERFVTKDKYIYALDPIRDYVKQVSDPSPKLHLTVPWFGERLFEPSGPEAIPREDVKTLLLKAMNACTQEEADFASALLNGTREQNLLDIKSLNLILDNANNQCSKLIKASSPDACIRNWARIYRRLGHPQRAASICLDTLRCSLNTPALTAIPLAHHYAALCYVDYFDLAKALAHMKTAVDHIKRIPSRELEMKVKMHNAYAVILRETRRMPEAEEQFRLAWEINQNNVINCIAFGTYWRHMNDEKNADKYYLRAYKFGGLETRLKVLLNMGKMAFTEYEGHPSNPMQARDFAEDAVKLMPTSIEAQCMLAKYDNACSQQSNEPLAMLKVLMDAGHEIAACQYAEILLNSKQPGDAVEGLHQFAERPESSLATKQLYARCLGKKGDIDLAVAWYRISFDKSKNMPIETNGTLRHRLTFAQFLFNHRNEIPNAKEQALNELRPFANCRQFGGPSISHIIAEAAKLCGDLASDLKKPELAKRAYATARNAISGNENGAR